MSEIQTVVSSRAGEHYDMIEHPSGLRIMVFPKEGCHSSYAIFGTRFGSIDTRFRRSDESEDGEVPAGIAHFLEHKSKVPHKNNSLLYESFLWKICHLQ